MNRIHIKGTLTADDLKLRMIASENIVERNRWQALYLAASRQISASYIADIVGVSVHSVNKWVSLYNRKGVESIYSKPRGGRLTSFLTWQEEEMVLEELREKANKGLLVMIKMVKAEIEQRLQHHVSKDYPYDLLHRHGWRRVAPRPKHPKQDPAKQAEFKKKLPEYLATAALSFAPGDDRPIKVFFQDEARFGRINIPSRCWAPAGQRPVVPKQIVRQYIYAYSAVSPLSGDICSILTSNCDTDSMAAFLKVLSKEYGKFRNIVIMDRAGWHTTTQLKSFPNIRFIFLPPYSPELNPTEHLWNYIRNAKFRNSLFENLDDVQEALITSYEELDKQKDMVASMTHFKWLNLSI